MTTPDDWTGADAADLHDTKRVRTAGTGDCDRCGARINARYDYCQDCFQAIRRRQARR